MEKKDNRPEQVTELRRRAEEIAREKSALLPENIKALSPEETQRTLQELRVHQIELEMQNEELRRAQAELDATRARYFDLYDLAPVGYCTVSEKGLILEANLTACTLLGVTRSVMFSKPITRFILKADQDIYYLHRKQLFETGKPQICEIRMLKQDGTTFWAHLEAAVAQDTEGNPVARVVMSDITGRKRAEEAILETNLHLKGAIVRANHMAVVAKIANMSKNAFMANMSHELRTPLNSIIGFTELMIENPTDLSKEKQEMYLEKIHRNGICLLGLINDILDLSRIDAGKMKLEYESVDIRGLINECLDEIAPAIKSGQVELRRIFDPSLQTSSHWNTDPIRLRQIMLNLLGNASKFTSAGHIEVRVRVSGDQLVIEVEDTGRGIAAEDQSRIFNEFEQADSSSTRSQGGAGLGLAICRRLCDLMKGSIRVESKLGEGSCFILELPINKPFSGQPEAMP
ncbi:MAG: ATP-binding protein [Phycisphaerae bacterium]